MLSDIRWVHFKQRSEALLGDEKFGTLFLLCDRQVALIVAV